MKEKKEDNDNKQRLKVYPFSTEESLNQKFNSTLKVEKFLLQLIGFKDFNSIFLRVRDYLMEKKEVHSLEIILQQLQNFDFEHSLYLLKGIHSISSLYIQFSGIQFQSVQLQTLSSSLLAFINLTELQLDFRNQLFDCIDESYSLNEAYSHLVHLQILKISFYEFLEVQTVQYSILEGMRKLQRLEKLKFSIFNKIKSSNMIDCLEKELKYLINLKKFTLFLGWQSFVTYHELKNIGNILLYLQKLENLKIFGYFNKGQKSIQFTGLEDSISQLKQLKKCNFQFYQMKNINIYPLLDILSQIQSLERITLIYGFLKPSQFDFDLLQMGQAFAKISKLIKLKLEFNNQFKFSIQQYSDFINELEPLDKLEKLELNVNQLLTKSTEISNLKGVKSVLSKLKNFNFNAFEDKKDDVNYSAGLLLTSLKDAKNLQDLTFLFRSYGDDNKKCEDLAVNDLLLNKKCLNSINLQLGSQYKIQDIDFQTFIEHLQQNTSLSTIILRMKSQISQSYQIMKSFINTFTGLEKLTYLDLEIENSKLLDKIGYEIFLEDIPSLSQLTSLSLNIFKDALSTTVLNRFTSKLQSMKKLASLKLQITGNNFSSDEEEQQFGNSFKLPLKPKFIHFIFQIKKVKYSNLQNIFKELSQLRKLSYFYLIFDNLIITLPEVIQLRRYLSNLQILRGMNFYGYSVNLVYLLNLFQDIPSLENIDLANDFKKDIFNQVTAKKRRQEIKLDQVNKYQQDICAINKEDHISLMLKNEYLFNQENNIEDIYNLQFILFSLHFLHQLNLSIHRNNQIGSKAAHELFKNIIYLINLKELVIGICENNQIGMESINQLGHSLKELLHLKILKIKISSLQNDINWQQSQEFTNSLRNLKLLRRLELSFQFNREAYNKNNIESQFLNALFNSIKSMKELNYLKFNLLNYYFSNVNITEFSLMLDEINNKLRSLVIYFPNCENNQLFIKNLLRLNDLQCLTLQNNLTIHVKPLKKMKRLTQLNLTDNYFYFYYDP